MEKQKILIIDDDPHIRKTLSDILKFKGYETYTASSGQEGSDFLKRSPVNLVIVDLGLPDMSGLEVLSRVKADNPFTEVIILTGNASLDSAIEATNKGAFSYFLKPPDIDQLMLNIKRAIEKQEAGETIARHNKALEKINAQLSESNRELTIEIQERKKVEEALHALRLQLSEAMGLARIVYWEFDPANGFFLFNDAFYSLYGTTTGQEGGYRMHYEDYINRFVHPEDMSLIYQNKEKIDTNQELRILVDLEHRIVRRDGEVRHILNRSRIIKDADGRLIQLSGANQDITERKEAELEKEKLILELKKSLAEIKTLSGLLPICAWCKKIRDDTGYWQQLESYIGKHSGAEFSHSICPECMKEKFPDFDEEGD